MERLELAIAIAKEAGELTLSYFNDPELRINRKGDGTPVTAADLQAEELLRKRIKEKFPNDAILGEEFSAQEGNSGYRWILDPIDGTKSFIHGVPLYSTLIGVEKEGEPCLGVIRMPALGEGVWAEKGGGTWWEHPKFQEIRRAHVSEVDSLEKALFLTSEVIVFDQANRQAYYDTMEHSCRLTRTWGDGYGYYLVATGRAEIMIDAALGPWDAGPLFNVLEEAGGHFTDWSGKSTIFGKEGVGVNDALFPEVMRILK